MTQPKEPSVEELKECMKYHVLPIGDVYEHTEDVNCWCAPRNEEDIIIHNSFDRREEFENGRKVS